MRILFLDDDLNRTELVKRIFKDHNDIHVDYTETSLDTIKCLNENPKYDVVSLDHDLGGQTYVESGPGTGYEVACYIRQVLHLDKIPTTVILHTFNPNGMKRMYDTLSPVVDTRMLPFNVDVYKTLRNFLGIYG